MRREEKERGDDMSPGSLKPSRRVSPTKSNLEQFLQCVTPVPLSRFLPQSCMHELNSLWQPPRYNDVVEYFTLGDLWGCYDKWSAYGTGTEVQTSNGESVLQYFVPYLSAVQIYSHKTVADTRGPRDCCDIVDIESDSWSDDSMSDKLSRSLSNNSIRNWDSISEDSSNDHSGSSPSRDKLGYLYMQYFETACPYHRTPLVDKINELAKAHPGLMTLKNVDLSPASWMAVAWYPIYHIPSRSTEKDLSTCFLTYHTLSSSFQDCGSGYDGISGSFGADLGSKLGKAGADGIALPPFGLASYKMHGDIWINQDTSDPRRLADLYSAADSWLKQLNVHHHDFNWFTYHSSL